MSTRRVASIALALLVLATAWWLWGRPAPVAPVAPAPPAAPPAATRAELAPPAPASEPEPREAVAEPAPEPEAAPPTAPEPARVRGRCVAAESGAPLEGCTVAFDGMPGNDELMALHGPVDWQDPAPVVTGADGRFEIVFVPPPPFQHGLDVQAPGRVPRTGRWGAFRPGQVEDLGDIALALGYVVEGRVVDTAGEPVRGAFAGLDNLPLPIGSDMAANDTRGGRTDASGHFRIDVPIPAGTWSFDCRVEGYKLVSPDSVEVREGLGAAPVNAIVRRMPAISGLVVDETGAGVARCYVRVAMRRSGRMASDWTDREGRFTIHAVDDEPQPARLEVDHADGFEPLAEPTPEYAWGTTDVRIELRRGLSFELIVVERASGAPVEEYTLTCERVRDDGSWSSRDRQTVGGRHPGGRTTLQGVTRGRNRLVVQPQDPLLAVSEPLLLEVGDPSLPEVRVELERLELRDVRVVDGARRPVAGSKVELILLGHDSFDADSWVIDTRPGHGSFSGDLDGMHRLAGEAQSNELGLARLPYPGPDGKLGLRITGASHATTLIDEVVFPADGTPLEVRVAPGGRIAGKLRVSGYAAGEFAIAFEPADGPPRGLQERIALGADGSFTSEVLAPGAYTLYLSLDHRVKSEHGSSGWDLQLAPALATVSVAAGATSQVDLDGSALDAGEVRGTVLLNGAPSGDCRVRLVRESTRFGQFVPDAQGRFVASHLPPGTWRGELVVGDYKTGEGDVIGSEESFELAPGAVVVRDFAFARRRVTLLVIGADGATPLANAELEIVDVDDHTFSEHRTDSAGRLVLDPAPTGEIRLQSGTLRSPPLTLPDSTAEVRVELASP